MAIKRLNSWHYYHNGYYTSPTLITTVTVGTGITTYNYPTVIMVAIIMDIRRGYSNHHHFTSACQSTEPIIYELSPCSATPKFKAKTLLTTPAINTSITTPRVLTIVLGKSALAILVNGVVPLQPTIVVRSFANRKPTSESHTSTDIRRGH